MSAIGAENPKPDGEPPPGSTTQESAEEQVGGEAIEATDTTAVGAAMEVTDITAAVVSETTGTTTTTSTSTTLGATTSTTTAASRLPPRTQHAHWDDRLPGTRKGLTATACHSTLRLPVFHPPLFWDYYYKITDGVFGYKEDWLIGFALSDSSWEPEPGTLLHDALASLRVASAQEIRDRGEAAMDVRWYAWFVTDRIVNYGNPKHQSCASILAGAEAVFAIKPTATPGSGTAVPKWTNRMRNRNPG